MRSMIILLLALSICGVASADLGSSHIKIPLVAEPGTPDGREGGETADDAFPINAIPFVDTGYTYDNINDYDEVCPYSGSTAPDVVYVFTPEDPIYAYTIDLCESNYDTKVYVYENSITPGTPHACNDDAQCGPTPYRSRIDHVIMLTGVTYYIVVDGYGTNAGGYTIEVRPYQEGPPCPEVVCPPGAILEGEPPLAEDYVDEYNSGCTSSSLDRFQFLDSSVLCGRSGWFLRDETSNRDTDWFSCFAGEDEVITANVHSEEELFLFILLPINCEEVAVVYQAECDCDIPGEIEFTHPAGEEFWVWVGPTTYSGPEPIFEFDYTLTIDGIVMDVPSPVEHDSWGGIKTRFQ
jgi:hypothetical protein